MFVSKCVSFGEIWVNFKLDINNKKSRYAQVCVSEWCISSLSWVPSCYLAQKETAHFLVFNPDAAVVSSGLSHLLWLPEVICHLLGIYNVLLSSSPALLFFSSPDVFIFFQLMEISPVLAPGFLLLARPSHLLYQFLVFSACLTRLSVLSCYSGTVSNWVVSCCVTSCSSLCQVVIATGEHLWEGPMNLFRI